MKSLTKKIILCSMILLVGCSGKPADQPPLPGTMKVEAKPNITTLYFNSIAKPLKSHLITSKNDGVIKQMGFRYGTFIEKNQLLFIIASPQIQADYQSAFSDFAKAKLEYSNDQTQMQGTEELYKLGIISKQEYLSNKKQSFDTALSYAQAGNKLKAILEKLEITAPPTEVLNTTDIKKINMVLAKMPSSMQIFSPATGVIFLPDKSGGSGDSGSSGLLTVGSQVKAGQTLASIGDKTGLLFDIKVSEVNINSIRPGEKAAITGDAFPKHTLQGVVDYAERQPSSNDSGGIPSYPVHIIVPKITDQQKLEIRIGMSARVELQLEDPPSIAVPLTAVFNKNGKTYVKLIDKKTKKTHDVVVQTGQTTASTVAIQQGLKSGDEIVINATPSN